MQEIDDKIELLESEIEYYKEGINTNDASLQYMGKAIIIFDQQSQAEEMVWHFKAYWMVRLFYSILKFFRCHKSIKDDRW